MQTFHFASRPDVIFPQSIRWIFLTILPFAWVNSVPTRYLLFGLSGIEWIYLCVVLVTLLSINTL